MKNLFTLSLLFLVAFTLNAQVHLEENFDNGIPVGWTQLTDATDGGWLAGSSSSLSSSFFAIPDAGTGAMVATNDDGCNCDKLNEYLILSPVDLSAVSEVVLTLDVFYYNATYGGSTEQAFIEVSLDGGITWEVVEEVAGAQEWQVGYTVDLSAYAGNAEVWVAFHYTDGGGWLYGWAVDNVAIFTPFSDDVAVDKFGTKRFHLFGTDVAIEAEVTNNGLQVLNSFDFSWSDGVNTYTENITGLDLAFGESMVITHPVDYTIPQAQSYNIAVWGDNPNGVADGNPNNNGTTGTVSGVTFIPGRKMLAEEATGTWCGWCPRGWEWMDWMAEFYPEEFVGIAVHNGDPMVVQDYDNGVGDFPGFQGYPSVIVDRVGVYDPSGLLDLLPSSLDRIAPVAANVSASIDVESRTLTVDGSAEFVTQLDDIDYRLNIVLTEDGVTGTGSGYNQVNYYSGSGNDPIPDYGINWNEAPATVPAADLVYNHVARVITDGWAGRAGSVPTSVSAGMMATISYEDTNFDTDWNPFNMHAVVIVLDNVTGEALNVEAGSVDVICPADLALTVDVVGSSGTDGSIMVDMSDPTMGFGGYSFSLNTGETSDMGDMIENLAPGDYTITVSDKIGCQQTVDVTVESINAVEDITALTSFNLTPNPATDVARLNARFNETVDLQVVIINTAGQVMESVQFDSVVNIQHAFNVSDYTSGVYLVKMNVGNQVRTARLIVK